MDGKILRLFLVFAMAVQVLCQDENESLMVCNGMAELCRLPFNQVTFPGSHNAGAGFAGPLKDCSGNDLDRCIIRNQGRSFTDQLQLGVRFFNIDTCLVPNDCSLNVNLDGANQSFSRYLFTCHGSRPIGFSYAGEIWVVFRQINEWMMNNRNEVIVLEFTFESFFDESADIYDGLSYYLEELWGDFNSSSSEDPPLTMSTHYLTNGPSWPTLQQAIESNQRIFVFVNSGLNVRNLFNPWDHMDTASSWEEPSRASPGCSPLLGHPQRCNIEEEFLKSPGYSHGFLCNQELQLLCNELVLETATECFNLRNSLYNRTVNTVLVDYPEDGTGQDTVFEVARELNIINIRTFLGVDLSGAAHHSPTSAAVVTLLSIICAVLHFT